MLLGEFTKTVQLLLRKLRQLVQNGFHSRQNSATNLVLEKRGNSFCALGIAAYRVVYSD